MSIQISSSKGTTDDNSKQVDAKTIQCYVNQGNAISFINNTATNKGIITNGNNEIYYTCVTNNNEVSQTNQILQIIPQNQLNNYVFTNKCFPTKEIVNEATLFHKNQFIEVAPLEESFNSTEVVKKPNCPICGVDFPSKRAFSKHMTIHENDREFKCVSCKMSYNHEVNLLVHIAIIHPNQCALDRGLENDDFHCLVCSLKFSRAKALQGHCLIHQVDEEIPCEFCSMTFQSRILHDHHASDHSTNVHDGIAVGSLHCKICGAAFENAGLIKRHYKQTHPKEESKVSEEFVEPMDTKNDQNFDPSQKRKSSKVATQTIKLYAQGSEKLRDSTYPLVPGIKRRGRPRKFSVSSKDVAESEFICGVCNRLFKTNILLRRHEVTHTGAKDFECNVCKKRFTQKSSVKIHMAVHKNDKAFKCPYCSKAFTYEHNMNTHAKSVHKFKDRDAMMYIKSKMGDECDTGIGRRSRNSRLRRVIRRNYATNNNVVKEDPDTFYNTTNTNNKRDSVPFEYGDSIVKNTHVQSDEVDLVQYIWQEIHTEDDPNNDVNYSTNNICEQPTKDQWDKSPNVTNIITEDEHHNTGEEEVQECAENQNNTFKGFQCQYCKKLFDKSCDLIPHLRTHSNKKPYKCHHCYRTFRLKAVLDNHVKYHWKLKEYNCELCSKSFNLKQTLKVHMRLHKSDDMKYSCNICKIKFNSTLHCQYHIRSMHNKETEINISYLETDETDNIKSVILDGRQFVQSAIPVKPHRPFQCGYCSKSYKLKRYLRDHMKSHENSSRKNCAYCIKTFRTVRSLQQHLRTQHLNRKLYSCSTCSARFISKASLIRHGLVHSTVKPFACPVCFKQFKAKLYCDRHINSGKCSNKTTKDLLPLTVPSEINKMNVNFESEIITSDQSVIPGSYMRMMDMDMNANNSSNMLVSNYVNNYNTFGSTDKYMVVSLDQTKVGDEPNDQNTYYTTNMILEDGIQVDNCGGMLENVAPMDLETIYNYDGTNYTGQNPGDGTTIYYYQAPVQEPPAQTTPEKGSLMDKFPILKATLFSDDDLIFDKPIVSATVLMHENEKITLSPQKEATVNKNMNIKCFHGCVNCNQEFQDSASLLKHVKLNHEVSREFVCTICNKSFSANLSLWAHSKIHDSSYISAHNNDFLACIACDQKFISVPSLSRHVRMQHNDKLNLYKCNHCNKSYKTTRELDSHINQLNSDFDALLINSHLINVHGSDIDTMKKKIRNQRGSREIRDPNYSKDYLVELQEAEIDRIASLDISKTPKLSMKELIKAAKEKRGLNKSSRKSKSTPLDPTLTCQYSCSVCHKGFNRASNLQQHLSVHTKKTPFQCTQCYRRFRHRCSLKIHEETKHSVMMKLLRCHLCLKLLRSQVALRNHMKIHLKSHSFQCKVCSEMFTSLQEQKTHVKSKECCQKLASSLSTAEKVVQPTVEKVLQPVDMDQSDKRSAVKKEEICIKLVKCVTCSVAFTSIRDYEAHDCIKLKKRSHQCILCDMTFISSSELCAHICEVHRQQKKYNCTLCNLMFVKEALLLNHQKTVHNVTCSVALTPIRDDEAHQCILCDMTFISSSALCTHICEVHRQQKKYNCTLCNLMFVKETLLLNHQKTVHNL